MLRYGCGIMQEERSQRALVALELVETEKSYVRKLDLFDLYVIAPLLEKEASSGNKGDICSPRIASFFTSLSQMRIVNKEIYSALQERVDHWNEDDSTIGDVFAKYANLFNLYSGYSEC